MEAKLVPQLSHSGACANHSAAPKEACCPSSLSVTLSGTYLRRSSIVFLGYVVRLGAATPRFLGCSTSHAPLNATAVGNSYHTIISRMLSRNTKDEGADTTVINGAKGHQLIAANSRK